MRLRQDGQDYSYLYDGKGNVISVIDSSQSPVAGYRYDAFGKLMAESGTLDQPFMFSTKRYDAGTGLSYYGYRYYSAAIGRWITRDPIGEAGGINLYGFVQNDPVNAVDPEGLFVLPIMLTPGAALSLGQNSECHVDIPCLSNCLSKYPGLAEVLMLTPLSLLNLKSPSQIANKRPNASYWTSMDKKWPNLPGANPGGGVKRPAGRIGRMKPVGTLGSVATAASVFGMSYGATALLNCLGQCTSCDCIEDGT